MKTVVGVLNFKILSYIQSAICLSLLIPQFSLGNCLSSLNQVDKSNSDSIFFSSESDVEYKKLLLDVLNTETMEPEVLASKIEATRVVFRKAKKRIRVQREKTFPGFSISIQELPASEQEFSIKGKTLYAPRLKGADKVISLRIGISKAVAEALQPRFNLLRNPLAHSQQIARAYRYHAERLHALVAEARNLNLQAGRTGYHRTSYVRRMFFRDLVYGLFPGYSYTKPQINEALLGIHANGDAKALRRYVLADEVRSRASGGLTWAGRNFFLATALIGAVSMASFHQHLAMAEEVGNAFLEAAERLEKVDEQSGNLLTESKNSADKNLDRNLRYLEDQFYTLLAVKEEGNPEEKKKAEFTLLVQNLKWDVDLLLSEAIKISKEAEFEVQEHLTGLGVFRFLAVHGF